jgi:hypothetical protein
MEDCIIRDDNDDLDVVTATRLALLLDSKHRQSAPATPTTARTLPRPPPTATARCRPLSSALQTAPSRPATAATSRPATASIPLKGASSAELSKSGTPTGKGHRGVSPVHMLPRSNMTPSPLQRSPSPPARHSSSTRPRTAAARLSNEPKPHREPTKPVAQPPMVRPQRPQTAAARRQEIEQEPNEAATAGMPSVEQVPEFMRHTFFGRLWQQQATAAVPIPALRPSSASDAPHSRAASASSRQIARHRTAATIPSATPVTLDLQQPTNRPLRFRPQAMAANVLPPQSSGGPACSSRPATASPSPEKKGRVAFVSTSGASPATARRMRLHKQFFPSPKKRPVAKATAEKKAAPHQRVTANLAQLSPLQLAAVQRDAAAYIAGWWRRIMLRRALIREASRQRQRLGDLDRKRALLQSAQRKMRSAVLRFYCSVHHSPRFERAMTLLQALYRGHRVRHGLAAIRHARCAQANASRAVAVHERLHYAASVIGQAWRQHTARNRWQRLRFVLRGGAAFRIQRWVAARQAVVKPLWVARLEPSRRAIAARRIQRNWRRYALWRDNACDVFRRKHGLDKLRL